MFTITQGYLRLIAVFLLLASSAFALQDPPDSGQPQEMQKPDPFTQQLEQYPGLFDTLAHLREKLSVEVQTPPLRTKSKLLPLVPASAVFYFSVPNYGGAVQQAHQVVRQELESNEDFRTWWQKNAMFGSPREFDDAVSAVVRISEYLGDEMVVAATLNKDEEDFILLAEVRKPGLAAALQQLNKQYSGKSRSSLRILTPEQLASPGPIAKGATLILVRPDLVAVGERLEGLRSLNARLNGKAGAADQFESTPFGRRIGQSYQAGVGLLSAVDVKELMNQSAAMRKALAVLNQAGFDNLQFVMAERRENQGIPLSSLELSFAGPRHGAASWLGAPAAAGGMDFIASDTTTAIDLRLKDLSRVLDDVQALVDPGNRGFTANLEMMQKQFNVNLRDDLLARLTGEIVIAVDPPSGGGPPAVRAILGVRDADSLQQTLKQAFTLLAAMNPDAGGQAVEQSTEGGVTYYSVSLPGQPKTNRLHYAFADNYLILGMTRAIVRDAIRLHQNGRSIVHAADFQTSLPRENNGGVSALLVQDYRHLFDLAGAQAPVASVQVLKMLGQTGRNTGWAVAGDNSIRLVSSGQASDVLTIGLLSAIAIPNLVRSRRAANESAAATRVHTIVTNQIAYATTYPDKGYATSLAMLGGVAACPKSPSARHACLMEGSLAGDNCVAGAWCERDAFRFSVSAECSGGVCTEFVVTATPVSRDDAGINYCATSDGVRRSRSGPPLAKPISAGECLKWAPL